MWHAPKFAEKIFTDGFQTSKSAKVFSLESFPLYGISTVFTERSVLHLTTFVYITGYAGIPFVVWFCLVVDTGNKCVIHFVSREGTSKLVHFRLAQYCLYCNFTIVGPVLAPIIVFVLVLSIYLGCS